MRRASGSPGPRLYLALLSLLAACGLAPPALEREDAAATWASPTSSSAPAPDPFAAAPADWPALFDRQVQTLFRVAACGGAGPLPEGIQPLVVKLHCQVMRRIAERHRRRVLSRARPFFLALRPPDLPSRVVYPFGGGDLLFALTVFPDAKEITSISLERAGDPRALDGISPKNLRLGLHDVRWMVMRLASVEYSFTTHMDAMQGSELPVQLAMALAALAIHGQEPVSLRYFHVGTDGGVRYTTWRDVDAATRGGAVCPAPCPPRGRRYRPRRRRCTILQLFANMELIFRRAGAGPDEPLRVFRHIAGNLHNSQLTKDPSLLRHLVAKGRVAAMTKAASYLLWQDDFSMIREYLLGHMEWMVSDSTGILPLHAAPAGFVQETYGSFGRSLLLTRPEHNREMRRLWRGQNRGKLPFRFGYPDYKTHQRNLLITRKPGRPGQGL